MTEDYKKGYRDGFNDGFKTGNKLPKEWEKVWSDPNPILRTCHRCGMEWGSGPMGYSCPRADCPIQIKVT